MANLDAGFTQQRWVAYDTSTFSTVISCAKHNAMTDLDVSRVSRVVATGGSDSMAYLWDLDTTRMLISVSDYGDVSGVLRVAISPDGAVLATGRSNGTIRFWRATDGLALGQFAEEVGLGIADMTFTPDGKLLVYKRSDGVLVAAEVPDLIPQVVKGDVDGSGKVNITDVVMALRFAVGVMTPSPQQLAACDVNGNGRIDVSDVVTIIRKAVGITS
ncbi:MAG TPA: dockerin type I domain-containing protein [Armatimonadota bacterium]